MLDVRLVHLGNGRFATSSRSDHDEVSAKLAPNAIVRAKLTQRRSYDQLKYFMAICRRAFDSNRAGPSIETCPTWKHMRAWLLVEAGHFTVDEFSPRAVSPAVVKWFRESNPHTVWSVDRQGRIFARTAKSISYSACEARTFGELVDKVVDIIITQVVPGTNRDDWSPEAYKRGTWLD